MHQNTQNVKADFGKNLIPFAFGETLIRVHKDEHGNPWWVAKEVCAVLELDSSNISRQGFLDDDEKGLYSIQTLGGAQDMLFINEPGLYSLIFRSRKPEARAFKRWVTHEVLPSIRKTGAYGTMNGTLATDIVEGLLDGLKKLLTEFDVTIKSKRSQSANKPVNEDRSHDDALKVALEVERREKKGLNPLPMSRAGVISFKWSQRRSMNAADRALELGLLVAVKNDGRKGFYLRSVAAVKAA